MRLPTKKWEINCKLAVHQLLMAKWDIEEGLDGGSGIHYSLNIRQIVFF